MRATRAGARAGPELRVVLPSVRKVLVVRRVHARAQDLWDRHVVRAGPCAPIAALPAVRGAVPRGVALEQLQIRA